MRHAFTLAAIAVVALSFGQNDAQPAKILSPGDKAPELKVSKWVQGDEFKIAPGKIQVVEFWATWCGPCKTSIPHLNKLYKTYKGKVDFVGVSIWEDGDDIEGQVNKFVEGMGDEFSYAVALDNKEQYMSKEWMTAAQEPGIPTAFIVQDKKVLWIGHPMNMDEPLKNIVEGKFDLKAHQEEKIEQRKQKEEANKAMKEISNAKELYKSGKKEEALKLLDEMAQKSESLAIDAKMVKLELLASDNVPAAKKVVDEIAKKPSLSDLFSLVIFGMNQAQGENGELAVYAVEKALGAMKKEDAVVLFYASFTYSGVKDWKKTVSTLEKALKAFDSGEYKDDPTMADLRKEIEQALKAAREKAKQTA